MKEDLDSRIQRMSKTNVHNFSSTEIFLDIPEYFKEYTEPLLDVMEEFNLRLDGLIGTGDDGSPMICIRSKDISQIGPLDRNYKSQLRHLEKSVNGCLRSKWLAQFFRGVIRIPPYSVKIGPYLDSQVLRFY